MDDLHSAGNRADRKSVIADTDQTPPRFHANFVAAHGGPYDITLDFGYRAEPQDNPTTEVRISMSWEHAMSVAKILDGLISEYERQVPSLGAMRVKLAQAQEAARISAQEQA